MPPKSKLLPYAAAVVSSVTWGFSFLFTKHALGHLQPFQLLGFRFIVAALILTALAALRIVKIRLTSDKLKGMLVVALLQPVLYFLGETFGVKLTSATESGILIALVPIAVSICSVWLLQEKLSPAKWIAVAVCVGGVVLIVAARGFGAGGGQMLGVLSLIGAVIAAGFYTPLSRKVSRQSTPIEITFVMMWVGAIVFNAIGLGSSAVSSGGAGWILDYFRPFADPTVLVEIGYLGVLSSLVAFFCLNYALSKLESTVVGTFTNLVPVITVFAGVVIGGESLLPLQCVGAALILAGIWGTARRKPARARAPLPVQPE